MYADLLIWAHQAGILSKAECQRLKRHSQQHPKEAEATLHRARELRESMFTLFAAAARHHPTPGTALDHLNVWLGTCLSHLELESREPAFAWKWRSENQPLDWMLWPVVRSAGDLLTSDLLLRLRLCASERCDWLFLDHSKNRTRRWCDMTLCGNRAKAKRHRANTQLKLEGPDSSQG